MPSIIGPPSHHEEPEGLRQAKRSKRREEEGLMSPLPLLLWWGCYTHTKGRRELAVVLTRGPWSFCRDEQRQLWKPAPALSALLDKRHYSAL